MAIEGNNSKTISFPNEGVIVNIPAQSNGLMVIPRLLDVTWQPEMRGRDNFNPNRLVINVEFVDEKNPEEYLVEFDPPIEMQVFYTLGDRSFAEKDGRTIAIAYWKDGQWKLIDESNHSLIDIAPLSPGWAGILRFSISIWGEPAIALGS